MIKKLRRPNQEGFTLVELMVTLAIIGVLMAIAIPNYLSYLQRGSNSAALTEATNFYHAALAQVADDNAGATFDAGNLPTGFASHPNVTISDSMSFDVDGTTAAAPLMTFDHDDGTSTYTLNLDGTVTGG